MHGGLGALSMVRKARDLLLDAEKIDPSTLQGSVYASLGSLYYQVPGWPVGFGDKKKERDNFLTAETLFRRAGEDGFADQLAAMLKELSW